jgi:hypothetical protein
MGRHRPGRSGWSGRAVVGLEPSTYTSMPTYYSTAVRRRRSLTMKRLVQEAAWILGASAFLLALLWLTTAAPWTSAFTGAAAAATTHPGL